MERAFIALALLVVLSMLCLLAIIGLQIFKHRTLGAPLCAETICVTQ